MKFRHCTCDTMPCTCGAMDFIFGNWNSLTNQIDFNVTIGDGTKIWYYSHISEGAIIGKNCIIGDHVFVGKDVVIGDGCKIQNDVSIFTGVELKNDVFVGPGTKFTNVKNPRAFIERKDEFQQTFVDVGASIGANCTILCGLSIGKYAMIGAGSVVTKNVAPHTVVIGNPARVVATIDESGNHIYYS